MTFWGGLGTVFKWIGRVAYKALAWAFENPTIGVPVGAALTLYGYVSGKDWAVNSGLGLLALAAMGRIAQLGAETVEAVKQTVTTGASFGWELSKLGWGLPAIGFGP